MGGAKGRPNEHPFTRSLLHRLCLEPWCVVWRQNVGRILVRDARGRVQRAFRAGPPAGVGDISGYVRNGGYRLEIEVKAARGRLRPEQRAFADAARADGVVHVVIMYDVALSPAANVERGVALVKSAVAARRGGQ